LTYIWTELGDLGRLTSWANASFADPQPQRSGQGGRLGPLRRSTMSRGDGL